MKNTMNAEVPAQKVATAGSRLENTVPNNAYQVASVRRVLSEIPSQATAFPSKFVQEVRPNLSSLTKLVLSLIIYFFFDTMVHLFNFNQLILISVCDRDEEYLKCACHETCKNMQDKHRECNEDNCISGCFCRRGLVRDVATNQCIPKHECPHRKYRFFFSLWKVFLWPVFCKKFSLCQK